ncbi:hypothetical protein EGR_10875 [Echinococcus granulosus]|uniref:Uncharacterized protein n=1 Tax=Echinococcus granulosus TaxID=6210 RepID=W6UL75_ECHGR|nr:hypothetical protein EGR_10875 [Echinococcus granulosus]EUB54264.1 hypothetical protein EGR_10875 [Echinococcus granulosus]
MGGSYICVHFGKIEVIELAGLKNFATGLPRVFKIPQDECTVSKKWCRRRFSEPVESNQMLLEFAPATLTLLCAAILT